MHKRIKSFQYAFKGIAVLLKTQANAKIHLVITLLVIAAGIYFHISAEKWLAIVIAIISVFSAEAFNTALEFLSDAVSKDHHPLIGNAKDAAAGGVLISSIGAAIIGGIVFVPELITLIKS